VYNKLNFLYKRNNLAKRAILQLVFLSTLLIFLSLTNVPGQTTQPIYKVGDYFVYKVELAVTGYYSCSWEATIRVEITKIDFPYVDAKIITRNVKTSGSCPYLFLQLPSPPNEGEGETSFRIDKKPSIEQIALPPLVDPSYSTTFQTSTTTSYGTSIASYKYNKGVLISENLEIAEKDYKVSLKINLIETSVPGLISDNIMWWIIIGVIIAVVVTVVIVTLYIIMRRRKALAPPTPPSVTPLAPNYCPSCGSPVNPEDVYCGKCGRKLK
jgi:hypothetical protein